MINIHKYLAFNKIQLALELEHYFSFNSVCFMFQWCELSITCLTMVRMCKRVCALRVGWINIQMDCGKIM